MLSRKVPKFVKSITMFVSADDVLQGLAPFTDDGFPVGQRGIRFIRFLVGRGGERVAKFGARFVGRWRWFHFCENNGTVDPSFNSINTSFDSS